MCIEFVDLIVVVKLPSITSKIHLLAKLPVCSYF